MTPTERVAFGQGTRMTPPDRVALGAAWLDETEGPEWVERVNLDELRLDDSCGCICGQTFHAEAAESGTNPSNTTGYWFAFDFRFPLGDKRRWAVEHGFLTLSDLDDDDLQAAWSDLIIKRRGPNAERTPA